MKRLVKIFLIILVVIIITNISFAKYITIIKGQGKLQVREPILILSKKDVITGEISKINNQYETEFTLKNYLGSGEKVNEIDFEYIIKLIPSTNNFPAEYSLINSDTNEKLVLNEDLETEKMFIGTEKQIHNYKLLVNWSSLSVYEPVEENLEVKINIKATQIKKENL